MADDKLADSKLEVAKRIRDGTTTLSIIMGAPIKGELRRIISEIPHETMANFCIRGIKNEMVKYYEDQGAYIKQYGGKHVSRSAIKPPDTDSQEDSSST